MLLYVFGTIAYEDTFGMRRYIKIRQMILWFNYGTPMVRNYGDFNESN